MTGLKTGCLYSYGCRMAKEKGVQGILLAFIKGGEIPEREVVEALQQLQSYPAYRLITNSRNGNNVFAKEVVRAYWFGNEHSVSGDIGNLNHSFATLEKLVLLENLKTFSTERRRLILDCSVSSGKVIKLSSDRIEVTEIGLMPESGKVIFGERRRSIGVGFVQKRKISKDSIVSIHLGTAREMISEQVSGLLQKTTREALEEYYLRKKSQN